MAENADKESPAEGQPIELDRREFLKYAWGASIVLFMGAAGVATYLATAATRSESKSGNERISIGKQTDARSARPNIILILADDMGFSDAGCYGGEIETPNLDRLSKNGIRYTQMYNTSKC